MTQLSEEYEKRISEIVNKLTLDTKLKEKGELKFGKKNKWIGDSGHDHQIDVSLHNKDFCLLVECKRWNNRISVQYVLSLLGRVKDISLNKKYKGMRFKGLMVCPLDLQRGANKIINHYNEILAYAKVTEEKEIKEIIYNHYIYFDTVIMEPKFYSPTIKVKRK